VHLKLLDENSSVRKNPAIELVTLADNNTMSCFTRMSQDVSENRMNRRSRGQCSDYLQLLQYTLENDSGEPR